MRRGEWTGGGGEDDGARVVIGTDTGVAEGSKFKTTAGVTGETGRVELEMISAFDTSTATGFGLVPDPVRAKGKVGGSCGPGDAGGKSRSFHVPGMSATGRIHVAVSMIPYPKWYEYLEKGLEERYESIYLHHIPSSSPSSTR